MRTGIQEEPCHLRGLGIRQGGGNTYGGETRRSWYWKVVKCQISNSTVNHSAQTYILKKKASHRSRLVGGRQMGVVRELNTVTRSAFKHWLPETKP